MKKLAVVFLSLVVVGGFFLIAGCGKDDTTKPVITITNDDATHNRVAQFSGATYTDPGATATDDVDKTVTVSATGTVNMNSAADYVITYSATDKAGNKADANRTVTVDGGYFLQGSYTAEDFIGTYPSGSTQGTYPETITPSTTVGNKIIFTKFAKYVNANVYCTISGTTITIPQQTILCGNPAFNHTFTGSGSFINNNPVTFYITYHDVSDEPADAYGYDTYTHQ